MQYDWDWTRAERELQLAVSGASSATAEANYAFLLIFRGRFAEADRHLRRMLDLDPFSTVSMHNLVLSRNLEGRFAESREVAQRISNEYPNMIAPPRQMLGLTYVEEGHPELALPVFEELKQRMPEAQLFEAMAYAKGGHKKEALEVMRPFEEKYPHPGVSMQWFALTYAFMGDEPNTVKWLGRSADLHEFQALNLGVHPGLRAHAEIGRLSGSHPPHGGSTGKRCLLNPSESW